MPVAAGQIQLTAEPTAERKSLRWTVLALLFVATTINYLDRAILGILLPEIRAQFGLTTETYGWIQTVFQFAYGAGAIVGGQFIDRLGTRRGYGWAVAFWSAAATLNAFAASVWQFGFLRILLGLGESPNFPATNKAVAENFSAQGRASATGVINFGVNFAQIIGPVMIIWLATRMGWRWCFGVMGVLGFLWLPFWLWLAKPKTPGVREGSNIGLRQVLKLRQAWGYGWAKFFSDQGWWFYMFWLSPYFADVRHVAPAERGNILSVIYLISGVGALLGGFASSELIRRGASVGRARKTTMLVCAILMPFGALGVLAETTWDAAMLFGLATFAHQAWMTNLFTIPGDVFPKQAVASANGFGFAFGAWGGGIFAALIPGYVIPVVGYFPVLMTISVFYVVAWYVLHRMMGNLEPIGLEKLQAA